MLLLCPKGHLPEIPKAWDLGEKKVTVRFLKVPFFSVPLNAKHLGGRPSAARGQGG